jgi:hypothetical protein
MIFLEARHALRFGSDRTKAKLGVFQYCAAAQFTPVLLDDILIEFGYFTDRDLDVLDARRICLLDYFIEERFCGIIFTHGIRELYI